MTPFILFRASPTDGAIASTTDNGAVPNSIYSFPSAYVGSKLRFLDDKDKVVGFLGAGTPYYWF